jgi:hypothetical protein
MNKRRISGINGEGDNDIKRDRKREKKEEQTEMWQKMEKGREREKKERWKGERNLKRKKEEC